MRLQQAIRAAGLRQAAQAADERAAVTARELAVLRLLSGDLSEREIGRELFVSFNTVHSHVKSLYRKLDASSRAEAVARARERGLL
ncbi:response regulator transcription factor [Conexibacter sp. SYSU D00693]|uniref:response regulator transcription factor n=1 Tax=Conexibacter sp. SYSU D00693 TaxID=2812560 RepID=UPI0035301068